MKENSNGTDTNVATIEDMKRAQYFINSIKADEDYKKENGGHGYYNEEIVELARILDHILSDYKRILKENEELKDLIAHKNGYTKKLEEDLFENCSNYVIPVQKVKDKIEELKKQDREWTEELSEPDSNFKIIDRNLKKIKNQIDVLQELLKGENDESI